MKREELVIHSLLDYSRVSDDEDEDDDIYFVYKSHLKQGQMKKKQSKYQRI